MDFLLYGANGYTAQLMLPEIQKKGWTPLLAGRSEDKIKPLAEKYGWPYRIFTVHDRQAIRAALHELPLVMNAAGPFSRTAKPFIEACLKTKAHYLDITGEIRVFEMAHRYDQAAKAAGIMLMPGTGFDVVPTDCMALHLKYKLQDASRLELAFISKGSRLSHGTATTAIEGLGESGAERQNGKIVPVPVAQHQRHIQWDGKEMLVISIPWGDVSTAYYTTGIPNIITYTGAPPNMARMLRFSNYLKWLLKRDWLKNFLKKRLDQQPAGPDEEERAKSSVLVWGEVSNDAGATRSARLLCPDSYDTTVFCAVSIIEKVLNEQFKVGHQTPAGAYGQDLILEIPGTSYY